MKPSWTTDQKCC